MVPAAHAQGKDPFQPVGGPSSSDGSTGEVSRPPTDSGGAPIPPLSGGGRLPRTGVDVQLPILLAGVFLAAGSSLRLTARILAF